jgi:hypothetical protein
MKTLKNVLALLAICAFLGLSTSCVKQDLDEQELSEETTQPLDVDPGEIDDDDI